MSRHNYAIYKHNISDKTASHMHHEYAFVSIWGTIIFKCNIIPTFHAFTLPIWNINNAYYISDLNSCMQFLFSFRRGYLHVLMYSSLLFQVPLHHEVPLKILMKNIFTRTCVWDVYEIYWWFSHKIFSSHYNMAYIASHKVIVE